MTQAELFQAATIVTLTTGKKGLKELLSVERRFELCCHGDGKFLLHTITLQPGRTRRRSAGRLRKRWSASPSSGNTPHLASSEF